MKNYNIYLLLTLIVVLFSCSTTQTVVKPTQTESSKISFKAREYYLKGLFLQAEERFSEALVQFHKAQIFDTTSATIHNSLAENYMSGKKHEQNNDYNYRYWTDIFLTNKPKCIRQAIN